ncbi:MAG: patatin-like phospholipase family protein [Pseudomonadota bacterium]
MRFVLRQMVIASCLCLGLSACGTVHKRTPLPESEADNARVPGLPPDARFWGDEVPEVMLERFRSSSKEELQATSAAWTRGEHHYLALSGGGQNGAFGAGLLNGWTASGTRPEFLVVTGISTGALIAPFAFLGPDYDDELTEVYTQLNTDDLLEYRPWTVIVTGDSVVDTDKLRAVIAGFIDENMISLLGQAHQEGRRLFIGTTNLDARRPVIWSITSIAASDYPKKQELIVDILLASASIPGAFPPVIIEVEANGVLYDELHVDGGTVSQVFVYPTAIDLQAILDKVGVTETPNIYVIRNAKLLPEWKAVNADIFNIATSSIQSLIRTQGLGDLYQIYFLAQRDGSDYHLAYIPNDFDVDSGEPFDTAYMNALYNLGYEMAVDGYEWDLVPPGAKQVSID